MTSCRFHPLVEAERYCDFCSGSYCEGCSDESPLLSSPDANHLCFVCSSSLTPLRNTSATPPFWRVLRSIYLYPSSLSAVIVIVLTSVFSALFVSTPLLWIFPSLIITHYCFACLRSTALGRLEPPDFEKSIEGSISPIFYVIVVIFIALTIVGLAQSVLGDGFAILIGLFFICVLPAGILVIAIEEKLSPALNLSKLIAIVSTTGTSYFVTLLFIMLMFFSLATLNYAMGLDVNSFFGVFVQSLIGSYYNVVIFHILGYLIFQNQHKFGSMVDKPRTKAVVRPDQELVNVKIESLVKAGQYAAALSLCSHQVKSTDATMLQWERCFKLLLISESNSRLPSFFDAYSKKLRALDRYDALAEAYLKIRQRKPDFEIKEPSVQLELADALIDIGKYKHVIHLLRQFHKTNKDRRQLSKAFGLLSLAYGRIPGQSEIAAMFERQQKLLSVND